MTRRHVEVVRKTGEPAKGGKSVWCRVCEEKVAPYQYRDGEDICPQCWMPIKRKAVV